jgi:hypothetical protein
MTGVVDWDRICSNDWQPILIVLRFKEEFPIAPLDDRYYLFGR